MWICPTCNQEFKNKYQKHECKNTINPIDNYIASQSLEVQPMLNKVRNALLMASPLAQERISWKMPTYWDKHNIIHFAAFKKHIGIYPGTDAIIYFKNKLKDFKHSKGAIQLPYNKELPLELIIEIAKWCNDTNHHH